MLPKIFLTLKYFIAMTAWENIRIYLSFIYLFWLVAHCMIFESSFACKSLGTLIAFVLLCYLTIFNCIWILLGDFKTIIMRNVWCNSTAKDKFLGQNVYVPCLIQISHALNCKVLSNFASWEGFARLMSSSLIARKKEGRVHRILTEKPQIIKAFNLADLPAIILTGQKCDLKQFGSCVKCCFCRLEEMSHERTISAQVFWANVWMAKSNLVNTICKVLNHYLLR